MNNLSSKKIVMQDLSVMYPEMTSAQIASLQSTYCKGCHKNVGIEKIGYVLCPSCTET